MGVKTQFNGLLCAKANKVINCVETLVEVTTIHVIGMAVHPFSFSHYPDEIFQKN